jgi:hypothetical protein
MNQFDKAHYYFPRSSKEAYGHQLNPSDFDGQNDEGDSVVFWVAVVCAALLFFI